MSATASSNSSGGHNESLHAAASRFRGIDFLLHELEATSLMELVFRRLRLVVSVNTHTHTEILQKYEPSRVTLRHMIHLASDSDDHRQDQGAFPFCSDALLLQDIATLKRTCQSFKTALVLHDSFASKLMQIEHLLTQVSLGHLVNPPLGCPPSALLIMPAL